MKGSERTILLIEDDTGHARLIEKQLRRGGVSSGIVAVKDGRSALEYLFGVGDDQDAGAPLPELVILDLNLPLVDGLQVLKRLKGDEKTRQMPVVVVTTSDSPQEVDQCYAMGCNLFLTKPVTYEAVAGIVARLGLGSMVASPAEAL